MMKGMHLKLRLFPPLLLIGARICSGSTSTCSDSQTATNGDNNQDCFKFALTEKSIQAQNEFRTFLKPQQIVTSEAARRARAKAWNSYHKSETYPSMIVFPETTEEVSKIVAICHKKGIPIVPFGGGTALEGHTITTYKDSISVDFNNMRKILEFHPEDSDIRVQAGIGYIDLNEMLTPYSLWFPLDPGPGASIGGMCANRCSGSTALKYGSMRENVLNVTAVMSDGSIIKTGSRARKSSAGYDLTRLLIGSEGTLGLITEVGLKLHGVPTVSYALRVCFDDIRDAAAAARATLNSGLNIGRCEMLDNQMMKIVNKANAHLEPKWPEKYTLMYEIVGPSVTSVQDQIAMVKETAKKHNGGDFLLATEKDECKNLWMIRKACIWSTISEYSDCEAMITDACVPLSQLPAIMHHTRLAIDKSGLPCPIIAHAGDGNFHVVIMFKPDDPVEVQKARQLAAGMAEEAIRMGGELYMNSYASVLYWVLESECCVVLG